MSENEVQDIIDLEETHSVSDDETLIRLLCSPQYYDEEQGIVNPDAFDLRMLGKNKDKPEPFVSLGRKVFLATKEQMDDYLSFGNRIKWPEHSPSNSFIGYGEFLCGDAREVHDMVRIYPLKKGHSYHIGLFYAKSDGTFYMGPLPKTDTEILEVLADLAELLEVHLCLGNKKI